MEAQPGRDFNWKPAEEQVKRANTFLEELTRLSVQHGITLSGDVYLDMLEVGAGFKAPCGYVLDPNITCMADQDMHLNEGNTKFNWLTCTDLTDPTEDPDEDDAGTPE